MYIQALATCYNRAEKTLSSISSLKQQILPEGVSLSITIVDDGSTDNTAQSVQDKFPDVEILRGDGGLYWAGGMRYGWEKSVKKKSFDALLVFNDDIQLDDDALKVLLETASYAKNHDNNAYAITGAFSSSDNREEITYGGFKRSSWWHPLRFKKVSPNNQPLRLDTLNMNLVLISKESLQQIGFLSPYFVHGGADMEFGLRLKKFGGEIFLTPKTLGVCDINSLAGTSLAKNIGYKERIKRLTSTKEQPIKQRFLYYKHHAGFFWFFLFLLPYLKALSGWKGR